MEVPFVNFYDDNNILPVSQDISDLNKHFTRRESLFVTLGIPPLLLKDKDIIEFGPGTGHNAIYTNSLNPSSYVLIDGSNLGIKSLQDKFENSKNIKIVKSLFLEYKTDKKFDVLFAEGCIPHQKEPEKIINHLKQFIKPGGIFVITAVNGISYLPEILRRLMAEKLINKNMSTQDKIKTLVPFFSSHLDSLKSMTRNYDDWILDNIIQPLNKVKLFSIPQAIHFFKNDFEIFNSSPRLYVDWRWYKEINDRNNLFNETFLNSYYSSNLNLIDYRYTHQNHNSDFGVNLESKCDKIWELMCGIQNIGTGWNETFKELNDINNLIKDKSPETSLSLEEALNWLKTDGDKFELRKFISWWGRGQQYLSFLKK